MSAPTEPIAAPKEDPETLVLRGRPRRAIRFRRGVIISGTAAFAIALSAIAWMSLAPRSFHFAAGEEDVRLGTTRPPDALAGAPSSYGDVPKLGPPLPGDLGRPILEQQRANGGLEATQSHSYDAAAAERQRMADAEQSARQSAVLVTLGGDSRSGGSQSAIEQGAGTGPEAERNAPQEVAPSRLADPTAFREAPTGYVVSAGSVIPASLITGLNSDLPGMVVAQVTEPVRDSATGRVVLIPQGARLIGQYDSSVKFGQNRAFLSWTRLLFPDGSSIDLNKMPASDAGGRSGVRDAVDMHGWQLLKGVVLSTLLGLGQAIGPSGEGEIARAIRQSAQQSGTKVGEQLVTRQLDVQPTITVRPGWPVRALVHEDLVLPPVGE